MSAQEICDVLRELAPTFVTEADLQRELQNALSAAGVASVREVVLSADAGRIDILSGSIGVEVKVKGTLQDVSRQLSRYAACQEIEELVLVTTRPSHLAVSETMHGKPVHVVHISGGSL